MKKMKTKDDLKMMLPRLDRKSYGAYKSLAGSYRWDNYILHIDHVQGDPFASPSRLRFEIPAGKHAFPAEYRDRKNRKLALEDQILRRFRRTLGRQERTRNEGGREDGRMGSGKSGRITTCRTGQTVQERIAAVFSENSLEFRFEMGFPARGRTILAREMEKLLFDILPGLAENTFYYRRWNARDRKALEEAVWLSDDQCAIREALTANHYTAFVADGSILARESGVSDRPMKQAVPFSSPEDMRVALELPHKGIITGMAIPEGVTVIAGGGYHGKSTLLNALELGVYDHIAGDGREYVISRACGTKIRAEDGRSVRHTDISLFIRHLPNGQDTADFSSENASGSTSQAANLVEAMEAGSDLMFLDEDTSATNFMIRDETMAELVTDDKEPISTLLRHIRGLSRSRNISFIIVVGSSGDYLSVADCVLQLDHYHVKNVTARAREICARRGMEDRYPATDLPPMNLARTLKPVRAGRMKLKAMGTDTVMIDREIIDVRYLEQLKEDELTVGLAYLTGRIFSDLREERYLGEVIDRLYEKIEQEGFVSVIPPNYSCGQPALPRKQELYACLNRKH